MSSLFVSLAHAWTIAPVWTVAPVISGLMVVGGTLSATAGTLTGSPATQTFQWTRNGVNIGSATAATYSPIAADIGPSISIRRVTTATNAAGSAVSTSNALTFAIDTDLPGGKWGFLASAGYTFGVSPLVSALADQAATAPAVDLSQATALKQPTRNAANSNFNNKPTIGDTGGSANTVLRNATAADNTFMNDGAGMTLGAVFRSTSDANRRLLDTNGGSSGARGLSMRVQNTAGSKLDIWITNGAGLVISDSPACTLNANHVLVITHKTGDTGNDYHRRLDRVAGGAQNNALVPSASAPAQLLAFMNYSDPAPVLAFQGDVAVVWAWSRVLTANEQLTFEAYSLNEFAT